jgi:hypothetical protein
LNAILHSRTHPHQEDAETEEFALIAQLARRNPRFRQSSIAKQNPRASNLSVLLVSPYAA